MKSNVATDVLEVLKLGYAYSSLLYICMVMDLSLYKHAASIVLILSSDVQSTKASFKDMCVLEATKLQAYMTHNFLNLVGFTTKSFDK